MIGKSEKKPHQSAHQMTCSQNKTSKLNINLRCKFVSHTPPKHTHMHKYTSIHTYKHTDQLL